MERLDKFLRDSARLYSLTGKRHPEVRTGHD